MDRLRAYMKENAARIEEALDRFLPRRKEEPTTLHEAMRYSVFAGGKRLRPLLCLMGNAVWEGDAEACLGSACALELVHTYSLIHDDLPAMDNDEYRRGKLSCHKAFGEASAILAGDALLTLAFELVAGHSTPSAVPELVRLLARAAGPAGMVGGQILDLEAEAVDDPSASATRRLNRSKSDILKAPPLERVESIHRRKTGALIAVAVEMGAVAAGADPVARAPLVQYGQKIGLAFQIKDDILDIEAPTETLGKSAGKDTEAGKLTYPSVLGLDKAKALLRETIIDAKTLLQPFDQEALMLRLLADFIAERDH